MMNRFQLYCLGIGICLFGGELSCAPGRSSPPVRARKGIEADDLTQIGYPKGPWWRGDVNANVFGVSHILVSHRDAKLAEAMIEVPGPVANRSRGEALQLALALATRLRAHPELFSQLARESSEDARTAALGGELGMQYAPALPAAMVDALGNLRPGQVSRVLETDLGFHVLRRDAVPPAQTVSASEITIAYDSAQPSAARPGRAAITRTRAQALALGAEVAAKAKADPASFGELVERYSDARTAVQHGDLGEISSYDRYAEPLATYVIQHLEPGEVSNATDTPRGVRVFMRTAPARREFATRILTVGYRVDKDPGLSLGDRTREEAHELANQVAEELKREPTHFDQLQDEYCRSGACNPNMFRVQDGEGILGELTDGLAKVEVGGLVLDPIDTGRGFVFARREDIAKAPPRTEPEVKLELDRPAPMTLASASADQIGWYMTTLKTQAVEKLGLSGELKTHFEQAMDELTKSYQSTEGAARARVAASADVKLTSVLGPERATQLAILNQSMLDDLMGRVDGEPAPAR